MGKGREVFGREAGLIGAVLVRHSIKSFVLGNLAGASSCQAESPFIRGASTGGLYRTENSRHCALDHYRDDRLGSSSTRDACPLHVGLPSDRCRLVATKTEVKGQEPPLALQKRSRDLAPQDRSIMVSKPEDWRRPGAATTSIDVMPPGPWARAAPSFVLSVPLAGADENELAALQTPCTPCAASAGGNNLL